MRCRGRQSRARRVRTHPSLWLAAAANLRADTVPPRRSMTAASAWGSSLAESIHCIAAVMVNALHEGLGRAGSSPSNGA